MLVMVLSYHTSTSTSSPVGHTSHQEKPIDQIKSFHRVIRDGLEFSHDQKGIHLHRQNCSPGCHDSMNNTLIEADEIGPATNHARRI